MLYKAHVIGKIITFDEHPQASANFGAVPAHWYMPHSDIVNVVIWHNIQVTNE